MTNKSNWSNLFFWRRLQKVNKWVFFTFVGIIYLIGMVFIIWNLKHPSLGNDNWALKI